MPLDAIAGHDCLPVSILDPRMPGVTTDILWTVADWPRTWQRTQAARERIAAGTHSQAARDTLAGWGDDEACDDADAVDDAPEPVRLKPWEFVGKVLTLVLPTSQPQPDPTDPPPTPRAPAARPQNTLRPPRPALGPLVLARDMRPRLTAGGTLIKGLLDEAAMSVVYAPSNVGKSFLMLDLAFHIATGQPWRGHQIKKPGAVLYLAAEGGHGFVNRVVALKRHYGLADDADIPLAVLSCPVDLLDPRADRDAVIDLIDMVAMEFGQPVSLLVLDTLSRIMAGGDENGPKDMTAVVANIDAIRSRSSVHTAIVHHAGKDIAKGARGHSSLRAATDTELELTRTGEGEDKSFTVAVRKQRELPGDEIFLCILKSVFLGYDEDGDAVTSAVVDHLSAGDGGTQSQVQKMPRSNVAALGFLAELIASDGKPLPAGNGISCVTEDAWRGACEARQLSGAETEASRTRVFRRVCADLIWRGRVASRDGLVWIIAQPAA